MRFPRLPVEALLRLWLGVMLCFGCSRGTASPEATVSRLYQVLADSQVTGAPTAGQLAAMAPYLTTELVELLRAAGRQRDSAAAASPDDKPPFAEGDLFTSLFEGPSGWVMESQAAGERASRLPVRFRHDGTVPPVSWVDTVVVSTESGRQVVADVVYGGSWAFANRGALVATLRAAGLPAPSRP